MTNLTSNNIFDKAFPNERVRSTSPFKTKEMEKDVKQIFNEIKIVDYRCYLNKTRQTVYYMIETQTHYIAYREELRTKKNIAYAVEKGDLDND